MKIAIYTRVSTHHQIDKDSLPLQRQDLVNYSKYVLNSEKYEIFEDAGYSGKNTDRPAFQDMISRIKQGEFTHLLVWKIDRISRNLLDFCDMYEELKKYNCVFVSKNEQFDTSSAMGEAMLKIILVFAELERKLTGERVKAVMLDRASKGLWNGAPMPLGYDFDKNSKSPVINEKEKEVVQLIYNTYLKEESTTIVRNLLNENNIRTKRNGTWTTKTISDIIRNPFYIGTYRYNYRETSRGKIKKENEWVVLENNHPPLISTDLYNKCNAIMDRNSLRSNGKFRQNAKPHVLAGLIRCGSCGGFYHSKQDRANKDGFRPSLYACSTNYNRNGCDQTTISEKIVYKFIMQFILNLNSIANKNISYEEFIKELSKDLNVNEINANELYIYTVKDGYSFYKLNKNNKTKNENEIKHNIKRNELDKYKRALKRLEDLYLFGEDSISNKDYILRKKEIENNIEKLKKELIIKNEILEEINYELVYTILYNIILKKIDNKEAINMLGRETLREFFTSFIKEIEVKDRKVIKLTFKNGLIVGFSY